tara:strand:- start:24 stop:389 length:366 start_codon:yes stop_codon:yes gene_type:complete
MANGDITKEIEYDKVEVVNTWNIQVRKATKIMEEQSDGSKIELSRSFHRHVLQPFSSAYKTKLNSDGKTTSPDLDADGKIQWTHTPTDLSGEDAFVKAIAEAAWTDTVKANYKTFTEAQKS